MDSKCREKIVFNYFHSFSWGTVVGDLILAAISTDLLVENNRFLMFGAIPCFYLHGCYIGGLIAGIQFDGVTRDVFYLPTLKINYRSYLKAQPPTRQWFFSMEE